MLARVDSLSLLLGQATLELGKVLAGAFDADAAALARGRDRTRLICVVGLGGIGECLGASVVRCACLLRGHGGESSLVLVGCWKARRLSVNGRAVYRESKQRCFADTSLCAWRAKSSIPLPSPTFNTNATVRSRCLLTERDAERGGRDKFHDRNRGGTHSKRPLQARSGAGNRAANPCAHHVSPLPRCPPAAFAFFGKIHPHMTSACRSYCKGRWKLLTLSRVRHGRIHGICRERLPTWSYSPEIGCKNLGMRHCPGPRWDDAGVTGRCTTMHDHARRCTTVHARAARLCCCLLLLAC